MQVGLILIKKSCAQARRILTVLTLTQSCEVGIHVVLRHHMKGPRVVGFSHCFVSSKRMQLQLQLGSFLATSPVRFLLSCYSSQVNSHI